jgi:hypothetical protein
MATPQEILLAAEQASGFKLLYCAIRFGQLTPPLVPDPNGNLKADPRVAQIIAEAAALDNVFEFYELQTAIPAWIKLGLVPAGTPVPTTPATPPVLPPSTPPVAASPAGTPSPFLAAAQAILGS